MTPDLCRPLDDCRSPALCHDADRQARSHSATCRNTSSLQRRWEWTSRSRRHRYGETRAADPSHHDPDLMAHLRITYDYIGGSGRRLHQATILAGHFNNKDFAELNPLARQSGTLWRHGHSTDVLGRAIETLWPDALPFHEAAHLRSARHDEHHVRADDSCRARANGASAAQRPGLARGRARPSRSPRVGIRRRGPSHHHQGLCALCANAPERRRARRQAVSQPRCIQEHDDRSYRTGFRRHGITSIFPATASATASASVYAPIPETQSRHRPARSAN